MDFNERTELIERIATLFKRKTSGTANDLHQMLNISRATFFRCLKLVEEKEKRKIRFDRDRGHYYFEEDSTKDDRDSSKPFRGGDKE